MCGSILHFVKIIPMNTITTPKLKNENFFKNLKSKRRNNN